MKILFTWVVFSIPLLLVALSSWTAATVISPGESVSIIPLDEFDKKVLTGSDYVKLGIDELEKFSSAELLGPVNSENQDEFQDVSSESKFLDIANRIALVSEFRLGISEFLTVIQTHETTVEVMRNTELDKIIATLEQVTRIPIDSAVDEHPFDISNPFFQSVEYRRIETSLGELLEGYKKEQRIRSDLAMAREKFKETSLIIDSPTHSREKLSLCIGRTGGLQTCLAIYLYEDRVPESRLDESDQENIRRAIFWNHWLTLGFRDEATDINSLDKNQLSKELDRFQAVIANNAPRPETVTEQKYVIWANDYVHTGELELELKSLESDLSRMNLASFINKTNKLRARDLESIDRLTLMYYMYVKERLAEKSAPKIPILNDGDSLQELVSKGILFRGYFYWDDNAKAIRGWPVDRPEKGGVTPYSFQRKDISDGPRAPLQNIIVDAYKVRRDRLLDPNRSDLRTRIVVSDFKDQCKDWQQKLDLYSGQPGITSVEVSLNQEIEVLEDILNNWDDLETIFSK